MGIGLIIVGTIFLLNPNINIVDILPDFIGYIFIYRGLYRLADIDDRMYSAKKKAQWLLIVSLVKTGFILALPTSSDSDVLLFTFCFAVIELLLCIPLFSEIFGGANYLCSRYDNEKALKCESEAKFFTTLFIILKNTLPLIPELFALNDGSEFNYDYYQNMRNTETLKRICIIGAFVLVLSCAIFMGMKFISYLNTLRNDREFISKLEVFYRDNVLSDTAMWARRYQNFILTMFATGIMFFNNFYLDTVPILPDSVGYIFFIVGALYLSRLGVNGFSTALFSIIGAAANALSNFYRLHCSNYGAFSSYYREYYKTDFAVIIDLICAAIFLITIWQVFVHTKNITSDNSDGLVFPYKVTLGLIIIPTFSTTLTDLLPALESSVLADVFPDYYALGSFIIAALVLLTTVVCTSQILKMRTNIQR